MKEEKDATLKGMSGTMRGVHNIMREIEEGGIEINYCVHLS